MSQAFNSPLPLFFPSESLSVSFSGLQGSFLISHHLASMCFRRSFLNMGKLLPRGALIPDLHWTGFLSWTIRWRGFEWCISVSFASKHLRDAGSWAFRRIRDQTHSLADKVRLHFTSHCLQLIYGWVICSGSTQRSGELQRFRKAQSFCKDCRENTTLMLSC